MTGTLIIGYGNLLRGDDAVGCHAAHALEQHFRDDPEVEVIATQQLTPEMAEDVSRCGLVLFLDASSAEKPGTIRQSQVLPGNAPGGFTHQLTPSTLLAAAQQLYGDSPEAICITLEGWSYEVGNKLSAGARLRLPEFVRRAQETVESYRPQKSQTGEILQSR
ncbi:MAG: hydrogenase maturation protease [Candidatus Korobacteraceae bacterium]